VRLSRDSLAGALCFGLSLGMLYLAQGLPKSPLVPIGPDFYPRLVLMVTAALSLGLIAADAVRSRRRTPGGEAPGALPRNYRLVLLTFLVFGIYVGLLPQLGYRVATLAFVAALQILLDPPKTGGRWVAVAAVALGTTAITYIVFEQYLSVLLPRGRWTGF
jgi:putative tricarboxylic transport membrane protein